VRQCEINFSVVKVYCSVSAGPGGRWLQATFTLSEASSAFSSSSIRGLLRPAAPIFLKGAMKASDSSSGVSSVPVKAGFECLHARFGLTVPNA
jgi:hypothetical protein